MNISDGGYPNKLAKNLKCPIEFAQNIFDRFHNDLYPVVKDYRENYVLPTVQSKGHIHLGLGAILKSKNPEKDIRTLSNSTMQFWSILTLIALHRIKKRIKTAGYEDLIKPYSTIHDEISAYGPLDAKLIKWYNDNLMEVMTQTFVVNQTVDLSANLDIGFNRSSMIELPNKCDENVIKLTLSKL